MLPLLSPDFRDLLCELFAAEARLVQTPQEAG
jgi:hypothetical protein